MNDHHTRSVNQFANEDRHYSAIGRFIFEFSQLEYALKCCVAQRIDLKNEHLDTIMAQDFATTLEIAQVIFAQKGYKNDHKRLKKFLDECQKMNQDRNRVVHGLWYADWIGTVHRLSNSFQPETHFERADELAGKADVTARLRDELNRLAYAPPSPT